MAGRRHTRTWVGQWHWAELGQRPARAHAHTHAGTHARTHTHTHTRTHTRAHTHTERGGGPKITHLHRQPAATRSMLQDVGCRDTRRCAPARTSPSAAHPASHTHTHTRTHAHHTQRGGDTHLHGRARLRPPRPAHPAVPAGQPVQAARARGADEVLQPQLAADVEAVVLQGRKA